MQIRRLLAILLTLMLVMPGGIAESPAQTEGDIAAVTVDLPEASTQDEAETAANPAEAGAQADDDEFVAAPADPEVPEAGELSLDDLGDDLGSAPGDVPADGGPEEAPEPAAIEDAEGGVTYRFIAGEALYAAQYAREGEEVACPEPPAAPEGMAFAGWTLEDGTPVFVDGAPLIAHADPQIPEINVLAVFIEVQTDPADDADDEPDTPADTPETASEDGEQDTDASVGTPLGASADPADDADGEPTEDKTGAEQDATEADEPAKASLSEEDGADAPEGVVPFSQSALCDGVIVTVRADAGTFPAGAVLSVTKVLLDEQGAAEAAVDEVRAGDRNVAARYTFDIRVLDAEGVELQPAEGRTVQVSFAMAEVADENLETDVYHIDDDMTAERLDVTAVDADTAVVETEGFSLYTVEFTYDTLQYVLEGGASVPLWEITAAVGLQGEPTGVSISDESLFCAAYEDGAWVIHSLRPFQTEEWMQVEIGGTAFTITVTDAIVPVIYVDENGNPQIRNHYSFVSAGGTSWSDGWYAVMADTTLDDRVTVTGDVNLILCDGATLTAEAGITVLGGDSLTIRASAAAQLVRAAISPLPAARSRPSATGASARAMEAPAARCGWTSPARRTATI